MALRLSASLDSLELAPLNDPILRARARAVDRAEFKDGTVKAVVYLMIKTMRDAGGVGLAAPQVGCDMRIIVLEDQQKYIDRLPREGRDAYLDAIQRGPFEPIALINPIATSLGGGCVHLFEGCLSCGRDKVYLVERYNQYEITGLDMNGDVVYANTKGWMARVIQHELDHLDGRLCSDAALATIPFDEYRKTWATAHPDAIRRHFLRAA